MKVNIISRFIVVSATVLGTAVVVTSQPGGSQRGGEEEFPMHSVIPPKVELNQLQEFKDSASLHLNDMLKNQAGGGTAQRGRKTKFNETTIIHTTVFMGAVNDTIVRYKEWSGAMVGTGGNAPVKKVSPAELAVLYYVFDQGIDMMSAGGGGQGAGRSAGSPGATPGAMVTQHGITANISPKDLGMTPDQLKQAAMRYAESKHLSFWMQARQGIAQGSSNGN